jgi:trimethylamine:corrinoid methyltransferase-like protein
MVNIKPLQPELRVKVLGADQVAEIRAATLHVLERVGVHFPSERALRVFAEHGAQVDSGSQNVRLASDLVLEAMSHAPRTYTLSGRAKGTDLTLDGSASYFSTDGSGTETIDFETGEHRPSRKADVAMMAHVADYLSSISFYWPIVSAQDFGRIAPLHELDASFNNTVKHIQSATIIGEKLAHYSLDMAEVIAGSKENLRRGHGICGSRGSGGFYGNAQYRLHLPSDNGWSAGCRQCRSCQRNGADAVNSSRGACIPLVVGLGYGSAVGGLYHQFIGEISVQRGGSSVGP